MSDEKEKIITPVFRVNFPSVFQPRKDSNGNEKYSVQMLFDSDTDLKEMRALAKKTAMAKYPDGIPKNFTKPFRKGEEKSDEYPEYEGMIFTNAGSKFKPGLCDSKGNDIISGDDFYSGCYAKASVICYCYNVNGNKGVTFGLQNLMKVKDGERLGARNSAQDDFGLDNSSNSDDWDSGTSSNDDDDF